MKQNYSVKALALLILAAAPTASFAQSVPALINYQGRVQLGTPPVDVNGSGQFRFALVDQSPVPFTTATATVARAGANQNLAGATFTVTNGGSGYTTPPLVTVSAPQVGGGVLAVVAATVSGGSVTGFTVTTPGSGYTANPTLTIAAPPARTPTIVWNNNGPAPADPLNAVTLPVTNGLYSLLLGDNSIPNMASIPPSVLARPDIRLRVWFNGTPLTPDQRLAPTSYLASGTTMFTPTNSYGYTETNGTIRLATFIDSDSAWLGTSSNHPLDFYTSNSSSPRMSIGAAGNVGIGTGSSVPKSPLQVNGDTYLKGHVWLHANEGDGASGTAYLQARDDNATSSIALRLRTKNGAGITEAMHIRPDGNVGIGSVDPIKGKLVVEGVAAGATPTTAYNGYLNFNGAGIFAGAAPPNLTSIFASNRILGAEFNATSDGRIKDIKGRSDAAADLQTLQKIEITNYQYRDKVTRGSVPQKKVIGQQVESVFPQAVNKGTDTVPDIFKKAAFADGWVQLPTDLKAGDKVRLIAEKTEGIHEVLEVKPGAFRTAFTTDSKEIFVFGREVNDFRTVDYEAIAMLNVSATQELARQLEAKSAEVMALRDENTALKAALAGNAAKDQAQDGKLAAQDEKLAALAKLLEGRAPAAAVTVSTQR